LEDLRAALRTSPAFAMERPPFVESRGGPPTIAAIPLPVSELLYAVGRAGGVFSGAGPGAETNQASAYRIAERTIARAANIFAQQTGAEPAPADWEKFVAGTMQPGYVVGFSAALGENPPIAAGHLLGG